MFNQNLKNESNEIGNKCKLTNEEIKQFAAFEDADEKTIDELREFVYKISMILYKVHHNETA